MKTVRFSALVDSAGNPDNHLLLVRPETDKALQKAIKTKRVVTVFQSAMGNKTDHGEVGFQAGPSRQYLIFPRSVRSFEGRRVVGIKYDLLESTPLPRSKKAPKPVPPARKKPVKGKPRKKSREPEEAHEPVPPDKVVKFPEPVTSKPTDEDEEDEVIEELKDQVRKAMAELEKGKQVAAFNLLKRIVGD